MGDAKRKAAQRAAANAIRDASAHIVPLGAGTITIGGTTITVSQVEIHMRATMKDCTDRLRASFANFDADIFARIAIEKAMRKR